MILAVAAAAGAVSFVLAFGDAIELQDDQLRQMAALLRGRQLSVAPALPQQGALAVDRDARVVIRLLPGAGAARAEAGEPLADLPPDIADGLHTLQSAGSSWRVLVTTLGAGTRAAVAQRTEVRNEIAQDSAMHTIMPLLVLVPVLLLLVAVLTRGMFRPLRRMAAELDRRSEQDLRAIPERPLPLEVRPFITAINRLLARVAQSVAAQRRFVADAAHELRSPLTALSLQAEQLGAADLPDPARKRLAALRNGIVRARELLEQLLTLARMQDGARAIDEIVSLQAVIRDVLEDLMPLAEAKQIDLGVDGDGDARVAAPAMELRILVKNLVDNAIRYTPDGGQVNLAVIDAKGAPALQVSDTGPGIPAAERERVFDAFYRVLGSDQAGSGLGLAIVRTIAERIGATVVLGDAGSGPGSGLRVTVRFVPAAGAQR
ncbi:MAG: Two-component system sensor histidine kinase [Burkholderiaceae bacterium]|nr:MAG: Two-component system sensor histidine kinase [Burkholderiaceae bacterium]